MKKHSSADIIEKLAIADQLASKGFSQTAICGQLGISVMTLHRWRARSSDSADSELQRRLLLENSRLRDAAANLVLEIRALEETRASPAPRRMREDERDNKAGHNAQREPALPTEA
jgi:putative transposase